MVTIDEDAPFRDCPRCGDRPKTVYAKRYPNSNAGTGTRLVRVAYCGTCKRTYSPGPLPRSTRTPTPHLMRKLGNVQRMTLCPEDFLSGEWTPVMGKGRGGPGSTRLWMAARDLILARDGYVCQITPGCTRRATEADHIIAVSAGGGDQASNLRAACSPCNKRNGTGGGTQMHAACGCLVGLDPAGRVAWTVLCSPDCPLPTIMRTWFTW